MNPNPRRRRQVKPAPAASDTEAPPAAPVAPGVRLIRKYGNRRLYDTHASRYVTLEDLVEVFAGEEEVQVVEAVSDNDITKKVLAQTILFEEHRRKTQIMPLELLRWLLHNRELASSDVFQKRLTRTLAELARARGKGPEEPPPPPERVEKSDELDELRRRLKALEKQIQRK